MWSLQTYRLHSTFVQLLSPSSKDKVINEHFSLQSTAQYKIRLNRMFWLGCALHFLSCIHLQEEWHLIINAKMLALMHSMNYWKWIWYYLVDCFLFICMLGVAKNYYNHHGSKKGLSLALHLTATLTCMTKFTHSWLSVVESFY